MSCKATRCLLLLPHVVVELTGRKRNCDYHSSRELATMLRLHAGVRLVHQMDG